MQKNLNMIVHEALSKKVEASGSINTSLFSKRLGDMEKGLTEKGIVLTLYRQLNQLRLSALTLLMLQRILLLQ